MAKEWGITREAQDLLAYESHKKAAAAYDEGFMDDLVVPCAGVFRDNNIREDISLEKMAELKPAFDRSGNGHDHRRQLDAAHRRRLDRAARLRGMGGKARDSGAGLSDLGRTAAVDFVAGDGLLMAPTIAVIELLKQTGLALQDFDYYEIHEAFAAQVLATLKAWESEDYCRPQAWAERAARVDRSVEAQRQGLLDRFRASFCRDRRANLGSAGQAAA